ncbi:MAG: hypothetical protein M1817_001598 [Caeruleum heppii]|nr:MAG: hypothetical protein M1817_001598 [Caeruleum heppii]
MPRKSDASKTAAVAAATGTTPTTTTANEETGTPGKGEVKDGVSIEDLSLPRTIVQRLAKGVLPPNTSIQKDALLAMGKGASVFVNYLSAQANEHTLRAGKKTIMPQDVLAGISDLEFDDFRPRLEAELAKYTDIQTAKRNTYRQKVLADKSAAAAINGTNTADPNSSVLSQTADGDISMLTNGTHPDSSSPSTSTLTTRHKPRPHPPHVSIEIQTPDQSQLQMEQDDSMLPPAAKKARRSGGRVSNGASEGRANGTVNGAGGHADEAMDDDDDDDGDETIDEEDEGESEADEEGEEGEDEDDEDGEEEDGDATEDDTHDPTSRAIVNGGSTSRIPASHPSPLHDPSDADATDEDEDEDEALDNGEDSE